MDLLFCRRPRIWLCEGFQKGKRKWGKMMEEYFQTRETLKAVLLITDVRHEPTRDDVQMYDFLKYYELPVIVIATKLDKVPKNKRAQHIKRTKQTLQIDSNDVVIPFSSETGEGKDEAWALIRSFLK